MRIVDCSTHFGQRVSNSLDVSLPTLVGELARHNIGAAWAYSLRGVVRLGHQGNDETLAAAAQQGQLIPVLTVDPRQYLDCREEIARCLSAGIRLFRLFPREQGWSINSEPFEQIVSQLRGHGAVLILSTGEWGTASAVGRHTADQDLRSPPLASTARAYQPPRDDWSR